MMIGWTTVVGYAFGVVLTIVTVIIVAVIAYLLGRMFSAGWHVSRAKAEAREKETPTR